MGEARAYSDPRCIQHQILARYPPPLCFPVLTGSIPDPGGALAGRPNGPVGGENGATIAVCAGAVAAVLPELLRACKVQQEVYHVAIKTLVTFVGSQPSWEDAEFIPISSVLKLILP